MATPTTVDAHDPVDPREPWALWPPDSDYTWRFASEEAARAWHHRWYGPDVLVVDRA